MKDCLFCKSSKGLLIKKYKYWSLFITPHQPYLGKSWIVSNRHIIDFLDTNNEEKRELIRIMEQVKAALTDLFQPDLFNYASLGNEIRHLHIHVVPRYKKKRIFQGIEFIDKKWNYFYKPYKKRQLPNGKIVLNELRRQIRKRLR